VDLPDDFDDSTPTPLVFFLHGYGGSRLSYSQKYPVLRQVFQNHTWIVAAVDCRTVSGYQNWYTESSRQDITDILNQLRSSYRIDSSHVHVIGNSMGGSGALKYAMFNNQVVASLVDIHGVTNFTQFYFETSDTTLRASLVAAYGGTPSQVPTIYANESALGNEQRFSHTPVMILHGTADATVSVSQSRNLNQSLSAFGYTIKYIEVPGVGHDAQAVMSGREMEIFDWFNSHPLWMSVHLLLTAEPTRASYAKGQLVTFMVNVFNQLNPALGSSLTLTVTGPGNYGYFDVQPISVPAGSVGEYNFEWVVPNVAGKYVAEVELAPSMLTAYDADWLNAT
jgi:pimeloyl-ACP methyl ester carboxylesterase